MGIPVALGSVYDLALWRALRVGHGGQMLMRVLYAGLYRQFGEIPDAICTLISVQVAGATGLRLSIAC